MLFFVKQESKKKKCWENNDNRYNYNGVCYETRTESAPQKKVWDTKQQQQQQTLSVSHKQNKTKNIVPSEKKLLFCM